MGFSVIFDCMLRGSKRKSSIDAGHATIETKETPYKRIKVSSGDSQDWFDSDSSRTNNRQESTLSFFNAKCSKPVLRRDNNALVVASKKCYDIVQEPFPTLQNDDEIIISNRAVGLNPIDWKTVDYNFCLPEFPWITGREMAGVVEQIGASVTDFQAGDRVWTSTYYKDRRAGCFQHYVTVPQHTVSHIPAGLDFKSAACLGVSGLTSAMTLWKWLDVPIPSAPLSSPSYPSKYFLIWGGSTVTAQFAIQLAVMSGFEVIAITSVKTRPLVQSLGARHVITRDGKTNDDLVLEIQAIAGDNITRAIDLVGTETANYCLQALSKSQRCLFAPLAMISSAALVPANVTVQTVEMKRFVLDPESRIYAVELNRLVHQGLIRLPTIEVMEGGLNSVQAGLERLKAGDMAGKKLVVSFP